MLACKSEMHPKAVDPYQASEMAAVYNVGLAECSSQTEEGKKRMRDCFSYLVKEVAKARVGRSKRANSVAMSRPGQAMSSTGNLTKSMAESTAMASSDSLRSRGDSVTSSQPDSNATSQDTVSMLGGSGPAGSTDKLDSPTSSVTNASTGEPTTIRRGRHAPGYGGSGYVIIEDLWDKFFFAAVSGNGAYHSRTEMRTIKTDPNIASQITPSSTCSWSSIVDLHCLSIYCAS